METPSSPPAVIVPAAPARDAATLVDTIQRALRSAGLGSRSGVVRDVNDTIRQALAAAGLLDRRATSRAPAEAVEVGARRASPPDRADVVAKDQPGADPAVATPGEFVTRGHANAAGARAYKLYVPRNYRGLPAPLIVMLHGCKQNPDDFAAGTRMNELADRHGFLVVYPEQSANANGLHCWNWFNADDQARDRGEPASIAGITRDVVSRYSVDERRVFIAGMSAGAAMAVVLGATYPDVYRAVGAHSGLPYGAAHDVPSAFAAMRGTPPRVSIWNRGSTALRGRAEGAHRVPTIVFHGDRDKTVTLGNGHEIFRQAASGSTSAVQDNAWAKEVRQGVANGRAYTRSVHTDASGRPRVEQWVLHGAGHAWSGGAPQGSYTDAIGPDASAEMVRFFMAQ
ncbi:MAG: PHB depolymerase family esterase [Proteobacteria bacterium]|nr:PHB depolymerase family esterase [Burkholderiales bacterium]